MVLEFFRERHVRSSCRRAFSSSLSPRVTAQPAESHVSAWALSILASWAFSALFRPDASCHGSTALRRFILLVADFPCFRVPARVAFASQPLILFWLDTR